MDLSALPHGRSAGSSPVLVSSGVDWISCSAPQGTGGDALWMAGSALIAAETAGGFPSRPYHRFGLHGELAGQVVLAQNAQSVFVQLSGDKARTNWRGVAEIASNVSRFDLQATVELEHRDCGVAERAYQEASRTNARRGRPAHVTRVQGSDGGATCYIGKRVSDRFGRVYDKGVQSGSHGPGHLWRWEVELKRESARTATHQVLELEDEAAFVAGAVWGAFQVWGAEPSWVPESIANILRPDPRVSDDQRRLEWLWTAVRPMVGDLIDRQGLKPVLAALALSDALSNASQTDCHTPPIGKEHPTDGAF